MANSAPSLESEFHFAAEHLVAGVESDAVLQFLFGMYLAPGIQVNSKHICVTAHLDKPVEATLELALFVRQGLDVAALVLNALPHIYKLLLLRLGIFDIVCLVLLHVRGTHLGVLIRDAVLQLGVVSIKLHGERVH